MPRLKNAFFVALGYSAKILFGLLIFLKSGRDLTSEMFAVFTQHLTFFSILSLLAVFGASNYLVKKFSQNKKSIIFFNSLGLNFISVFIFIVIACFFNDFLDENVFYYTHDWVFYLYSSIVFFIFGVNQIISSYFLSKFEYKKISYANVISFLIAVPVFYWATSYFGAVASLLGFTIFPLILFLFLSAYFIPEISVYFTEKNFLRSISLQFKFIKESFGFLLPVWIGVISMPITGLYIRNKYIDSYGLDNLALWQAGIKISDLMQQLLGIFIAQLIFPMMVKAERDEGNIAKRVFALVASLFFVAFLFFYFFSSYIFKYFMGDFFIESRRFLLNYILGEFFRAISLVLVYKDLSKGRYTTSIFFEIIQGTILVSLTMLMIGFSKFAIAYAYLLSCIFCFFLLLIFVRFNFKR